jgi:hypothetical protein
VVYGGEKLWRPEFRTARPFPIAIQAFAKVIRNLATGITAIGRNDGMNEFFEPPPGPPPLLTSEQLRHLAFQGWLPVDLKPELVEQLGKLMRAASNFFEKEHEEKRSLYPSSHGTESGFYHVEGEKEHFTLRRQVHPEHEVEQFATEVWRQAATLLHRILGDISRAAGYSTHAWDHIVQGSLRLPEEDCDLNNIITLMRLFKYYPTAGTAEQHVDIGLLTLCVGGGEGLQVLDRSTEPPSWINAVGPTILVGDFARGLMRNQIRAGLHQVVSNPEGRQSIVFALRPCLSEPTDLATFGGKGIVSTREYFYKIKGAKYNINASKEIREQQRKAKREGRKIDHGPSGEDGKVYRQG